MLVESGGERSDVDGNDGDDDTGQEDGGQLVDILHTDKDEQGHEEETDAAVDPHVVQQGRPAAFKDFCLRNNVHLGDGGGSAVNIRANILDYYQMIKECRQNCKHLAKTKPRPTSKISMAPRMYMAPAKVVPR